MQLNKYVLCAMDKSKTKEELRENCATAYDAADAAYDAVADAASAAYAVYSYAADAYAVSDAAYAVADAAYAVADAAKYAHDLEDRLNRYFQLTGESREDYENEIAKCR